MGWTAERQLKKHLILLALALYLGLTATLLALSLARTGRHLIAPQDDPYIHLAMAERLAHAHYGINLGEPSSPSSSLLWPILLVPLATSAWGLEGALAWNLLAGCIAAVLLALIVGELPTAGLLGGEAQARWRRPVAVIALVLLANLVVLTLLGMEHTLQVALAAACAAGLCRVLSGRPLPTWSVLAAAIAPWLRYEDLTLTLVLVVVLWALSRRAAAFAVTLAALLPLAGFSFFLHHLGLPWLPVSVLVKSETASSTAGPLARLLAVLSTSLDGILHSPLRWPLTLVLILLIAVALRQPPGLRRVIAWATVAAAALHLLIGRFGWFYRYEVYITLFATVLFLRLIAERARVPAPLFLAGALAMASVYIRGLPELPRAAAEIYGQQAQMHRFVTDFYHGPFAVNDLGEVSYQHGPSYVLDLFGLSSLEAARERDKSPAWAEALAHRHRIGLVMIYGDLLTPPTSWTPIGTLCEQRRVTAIGNRCVLFYSTADASAAQLAAQFRAFAGTLPAGTVATPARP